MIRRVALVRTEVSEKISASIISVTRIGELGTTLAVTSNRCKHAWWCHVSLVRTNVTEEHVASIFRVNSN
jgi:hypothetical protein